MRFMSRSSIVQAERIYKSLANRRRLAILLLLSLRGRVSVSDIAAHLKISLPATSRHLRALAGADLVESEQTSTLVYYFLPKDKDALLDAALKAIR